MEGNNIRTKDEFFTVAKKTMPPYLYRFFLNSYGAGSLPIPYSLSKAMANKLVQTSEEGDIDVVFLHDGEEITMNEYMRRVAAGVGRMTIATAVLVGGVGYAVFSVLNN